jgi:hypothetical protein
MVILVDIVFPLNMVISEMFHQKCRLKALSMDKTNPRNPTW